MENALEERQRHDEEIAADNKARQERQALSEGEDVPAASEDSIVKMARVVIPHADILTMNSTPLEILPAPAAGLALFPHSVLMVCDTTASAYGNLASDAMMYISDVEDMAGTLLNVLYQESSGEISSLFCGASMATALFSHIAKEHFSGVIVGAFADTSPSTVTGGGNLAIHLLNGNGELSDGNEANKLVVTTFYSIIPVGVDA